MATDLEIARAATLRPIREIAEKAGIPEDALEPYGRYKAKVSLDFVNAQKGRPDGALVLVTGINPTAAGEGKTTTTVGLGDALNSLGTRAMIALREPSLGPCFGVKGGATGGGHAQVLPMEEINLHFTGDFHAITSANNLLAAMVDNHLYWGNELGLDARRIVWRRAVDMNDRALRSINAALGGVPNGFPREDGFDITVASEVMAVFCLAKDLADLQARLGRIIVGYTRDGRAITARDLKADGAMAALLRDALAPNLVQTLEGSPALVHGGPFANIAHGCNSVIATKLALKLADVVVTEAGFGADLGAEKFLDIKCRAAGLAPKACVVVATTRALKLHGGVAKSALGTEDVAAVTRGISNLRRHVQNMQKFGLPVVVALNKFTGDTEAEIAAVREAMRPLGTKVILCTHWADGAAGTADLARAVLELIEGGTASFEPLYQSHVSLAGKIETVAREIYHAASVSIPPPVAAKLKRFEDAGFGDVPVCIAKTQYSFSADPTLLGAPEGHVLPLRDVRLSAGAGFVVAIAGEIMTMPGLPRRPAAEGIGLDAEGRIEGLF
ncbi:formate--tetrahydrofolate ligase [Pseudoroseomonas wenyumeiae]|uniref:Formate--tetrahydrofolate ligase n=1 Tax=Teichococcus wenyumeiae TaxID=2478470 RepID=A0A3A9J9S1_9PROT|nr:formate--tetrahydrofolate ligase [Pseudoroseomonas wenyumeiae]RKK01463.1 formate--tetrahydrofolate ligase [Pseudoroseomonas wenyumeiae]RMI26512.1 formate--tetrahydrofolate ligase [Pseudoroseomonas wenyumeiae]